MALPTFDCEAILEGTFSVALDGVGVFKFCAVRKAAS